MVAISNPLKTNLMTDALGRQLVCDLCRTIYDLGWATGTGGGVSVRMSGKIFMAPSGVQKERIQPAEIFVLDEKGECLSAPSSGLTITACKPLFMNAYSLRNAGAVLHSHSCGSCYLLVRRSFRDHGTGDD